MPFTLIGDTEASGADPVIMERIMGLDGESVIR